MTRDEVLQAAIRFLDQFIARGAAEDVTKARSALAHDRAAQCALFGRMAAEEIADLDAFDVLREHLRGCASTDAQFSDAGLHDLVAWMSWDQGHLPSRRQTADPAQWDDWIRCVRSGPA